MFGNKELERTCKRDGTVWFVPLDLGKKPPSKVDIGLAKFTGVGERMQGGRSGHTVKAGNLQSRRDTIIDAKRCPQCGSSSYDERKVKMPK